LSQNLERAGDVEEKQSWRDDHKNRDTASLAGLGSGFALARRKRSRNISGPDIRFFPRLEPAIHGTYLLSILKS
jgi:hypothetical protein